MDAGRHRSREAQRMIASPHLAERAEEIEWDVAVVGTGMGGATTGLALARLGRRVLFIEKGPFLHEPSYALQLHRQKHAGRLGDSTLEDPQARLQTGRWPLRLRGRTSFGEVEFFAPLGCGSGGSTSLY